MKTDYANNQYLIEAHCEIKTKNNSFILEVTKLAKNRNILGTQRLVYIPNNYISIERSKDYEFSKGIIPLNNLK